MNLSRHLIPTLFLLCYSLSPVIYFTLHQESVPWFFALSSIMITSFLCYRYLELNDVVDRGSQIIQGAYNKGLQDGIKNAEETRKKDDPEES